MAGRPKDVSDEELLQVLSESDDPALFSGDIADQLIIGRDAVRERLRELESQGLVKSRKRGNAIIWWLTEQGESLTGEHDADDLEDGSEEGS